MALTIFCEPAPPLLLELPKVSAVLNPAPVPPTLTLLLLPFPPPPPVLPVLPTKLSPVATKWDAIW
jgi:hypothetical protein